MRFYLNKRKNAFVFAFAGIKIFMREPHAKVHIALAIVSIALGFFLKLSFLEWCINVLCIGNVLCAELFNSTIEKLVDKISPEHNLQAGIIKDMAAGAVLLLCIFVAVVGLLLFVPKIILLF